MRSSFSDEELEDLATAAYGRRRLRCPRCEGPVRYREIGVLGRSTTPIMLRCKRCGTDGQYSPDHLEAMKLEWNRDDKIRIVERYWDRGAARCPRDDSVIKTIKSGEIGRTAPSIHFCCPRCGRSFWSQEVEKANDPESFKGKYEEVQALGRGGMGEILLVRAQTGGGLWAAKRLLPQLLRSKDAVKRFQREARILKALNHDKIVPIREVFLDEEGGVIVMPYVEGGTLKSMINDKKVKARRLLSVFQDIIEGLGYLHHQGVVHRDLKPENVLIDAAANGTARISDFGLARLVDRDSTTLTVAGGLLGTPIYAAPEQRDDAANVDSKCDLYALGLIAYEIMLRRSPYRTPVNLTGVPSNLQDELSRCLEEDPARRPSDGQDLLKALKDHTESG